MSRKKDLYLISEAYSKVNEGLEDDPTFQRGVQLDPKTGEPMEQMSDVVVRNISNYGAKFFRGLQEFKDAPQGAIESIVEHIEKELPLGGWASDRKKQLIDFLYTVLPNDID